MCWGLLAAVVQLGGFEAGTVLALIPLWGGKRRSHAVVEQAERQSSSWGLTCVDMSAVSMQ